MKLEMLVAIVNTEKAAYYSSIIQSYQANMQFITPAKGTAEQVLTYLGMEDSPKKALFSVVRADEAPKLIALLDETFRKGKKYKGVAFTVSLTSVIGSLVYGFLANDKRTVKE
jgi:hypothetical protein